MTELQGVRRFNFRHHRQGTPLGAERPQIKMRTYYEMNTKHDIFSGMQTH